MKKNTHFNLRQRCRSFGFAISGIFSLVKEQQNAWIHLCVTVLVVLMGLLFSIAADQWIAVIVSIVLVWMAEALNTAIELVCDLTTPEYHPLVKKAKDIAAGAVLVAASGAMVIGLIIFLPYFI